MKTVDIALKDLLRAVRSFSFLAMGFVVPLLVSGLFYFAFGGIGAEDGGFDLPRTTVRLVNEDQGQMGFSAGQMLAEFLNSEALDELLLAIEAPNADSARASVDRGEAGAAVIIPSDFTAVAFEPEGQAAVELYEDPTLTLGPNIVRGIIRQFVDGYAGSKIAVQVASEQLSERGVELDAELARTIGMEYGSWAAMLGESQEEANADLRSVDRRANVLLDVRPPGGAAGESVDVRTTIISSIMAGMTVFYLFFTGASTALTLLQEEESGTLPRLFSTPTRQSEILGGRLAATLATLVVQVVVLLVVSALVFGIDWGKLVALALVTSGLVLLAGSFGLFVISLLENTRQGGVVLGGLMTLLGMIGMINIFTANVPGAAGGAFDIVPLFTPHGWAVRGLGQLLDGGGVADVLPTMAVMLALTAAFFAIGLLRFRRRFA